MIVVIFIGNLYPEAMSTPIVIGVILGACILALVAAFWRKKGRILTIRQSKWTFKHEKTGKTLMEFDLERPYYLAVAIR